MWRDWDISLRIPFVAIVVLHTALARFFGSGSIFLLAGAVRWIREPGCGRRPTGFRVPAMFGFGRYHPDRHLVNFEKILRKPLIRLTNLADL